MLTNNNLKHPGIGKFLLHSLWFLYNIEKDVHLFYAELYLSFKSLLTIYSLLRNRKIRLNKLATFIKSISKKIETIPSMDNNLYTFGEVWTNFYES